MARPKKCRRICGRAPYSCFKPNGIPTIDLPQVKLLAEELEALRLADFEGLSQQEAADQMMVSRQTFGNIIKQARFKITSCLVEGKALIIQTEIKE